LLEAAEKIRKIHYQKAEPIPDQGETGKMELVIHYITSIDPIELPITDDKSLALALVQDSRTWAAWNYYVTFIIRESIKYACSAEGENNKSQAESLDGPQNHYKEGDAASAKASLEGPQNNDDNQSAKEKQQSEESKIDEDASSFSYKLLDIRFPSFQKNAPRQQKFTVMIRVLNE